MVKTNQTMLAQLIARAVIFALFLLALFVVVPALRYLLILFIITNIVLGFINHRRSILANIIFIILTPSLFIPVLEYLTTVILVVLIGIHLLRFYLWYKGGGKEEKKKEKKKFHILGFQIAIPIIILICFILFILFILLIVAGLFFSTTSVGVG